MGSYLGRPGFKTHVGSPEAGSAQRMGAQPAILEAQAPFSSGLTDGSKGGSHVHVSVRCVIHHACIHLSSYALQVKQVWGLSTEEREQPGMLPGRGGRRHYTPGEEEAQKTGTWSSGPRAGHMFIQTLGTPWPTGRAQAPSSRSTPPPPKGPGESGRHSKKALQDRVPKNRTNNLISPGSQNTPTTCVRVYRAHPAKIRPHRMPAGTCRPGPRSVVAIKGICNFPDVM